MDDLELCLYAQNLAKPPCVFVANLKIDAIYALYPESFCDKNLAIRKVFAFCDSACHTGEGAKLSRMVQNHGLRIGAGVIGVFEGSGQNLRIFWLLIVLDA